MPLLHCSFSWCWRSGSPCSCCSRCSCLSCRACNSRFERDSRSTKARFYVVATKRLKSGPRGAQEAPRAPRGRQETPRTAPRGAKRAPRGAKTRPRAIWEPFWLDFGPPGDAQTLIFAATVVENQGFRVFPKPTEKETQKAPNGGVRETKMAPRSAPGAARSGPRGAKRAPGAAKSDPGELQEPP